MPSHNVLVVSPNELFAQGLQTLLAPFEEVAEVWVVSTVEAAWEVAETKQPEVVVVDYGGDPVLWERCLERFFRRESSVRRVVLLSLDESGNQAVVYTRFTCSAEAVETWLFGGGVAA